MAYVRPQRLGVQEFGNKRVQEDQDEYESNEVDPNNVDQFR